MTSKRVYLSLLLSASTLLVGACATQSTSRSGSLDDRYFQTEVRNYQKLQHEGRVIYCQNQPTAASLVPYKGCITEAGLRLRVENARRARNTVAQTRVPPV